MYCQKTISRKWYLENRNNPEYLRSIKSNKLKHRYKIDIEEYERLLIAQDNKCCICKQEKKLHVDHCHETGRVRGLLCPACNNGLGCFKDNEKLILAAANYLTRE